MECIAPTRHRALSGAAVVTLALLDWGTRYRSIRTKYATITVPWLQQCLAVGAFVKVLACIGRHGLHLRGAARWAGKDRFENDVHIGGSIQKVSARRPKARTSAILLPQSTVGREQAAPGAQSRARRCRHIMKAAAPRQITAPKNNSR